MLKLYEEAKVFDIEADGLLEELTKLNCIAIGSIHQEPELYPTVEIHHALEILETAPCIVGHNIQGYDIPAIQKVFPQWKPKGLVRDTLVMSRLQRVHQMMKHSLEAWGIKLKLYKGDFKGPWDEYTDEMGTYCVQDVRVNIAIWKDLLAEGYPERAIQLEHDFSRILDWQMSMGIKFDEESACTLAQGLEEELKLLHTQIIETVPPKRETFIPKVNNKRYGYVKGVPIIKETPFNPGSRNQVKDFLVKKYQWAPVDFTEKGNPKLSGPVLSQLPYTEAPLFAKYFDAKKLYGQILNGEKSWLRSTQDGRIYGYVNHNGAVTGRCTHSGPNLAQVPSSNSFKGEACRALFRADVAPKRYKVRCDTTPTFSLIGCDADGLELRNLAHYMAPYDEGRYADTVESGDIHTENQEAAGLPTRDNAKTFIYAHNYGAGDAKLGSIVHPDGSLNLKKVTGTKLRQKFMTRIPALRTLISKVKTTANKKGYLTGLDGRKLWVRSEHRALNTLLQGAGSVIMKEATVLQWKEVIGESLDWRSYMCSGYRAYPVLHVHDETQNCVEASFVEEFKEIAEHSIHQAGLNFNYKCPLSGTAKEGNSWAETH